MSKSQVIPQVGDRVGRVCGPGEFPSDFQGTVLEVYSNRWYASNARIVWDDGTTSELVNAYTQVGIGIYLIASYVKASEVQEGDTLHFCIPESTVKIERTSVAQCDGWIGLHGNDDTFSSFYPPTQRVRILARPVAESAEPTPARYQVIDPREGNKVMGTYQKASRARAARDKLDNQYGAYRYKVVPQ